MLFKALLLVFSASLCLAGPRKYIRPCALSNIHCIRENLKANSHCNPNVRGSIPAQYTIESFRFETPYFNASYIDKDLIVRNHDKCVVSEFFFNTVEESAVIALDCPNLDLESDRLLIQHNTLQEDSSYNYHIRGTYPLIRLTMNVPRAYKLDICKAFTFADVTALPIFHIDPKDKPTANFLSTDLTFLNIFERELFLYRANFFMRHFVNLMICDFGCNY